MRADKEREGAAQRAGERLRKPSGKHDLHVARDGASHLFELCVVFRRRLRQVKEKEKNPCDFSTTWCVGNSLEPRMLEAWRVRGGTGCRG